MIVLKSTNQKLIQEYNACVRAYNRVRKERDQNIKDYNRLVKKANTLVERVRALESTTQTNSQFTSDELQTIRRLCHPDRHGNSEAATRITQKINGMV